MITPLSNASTQAVPYQDAGPAPQAAAAPQDASEPERRAAVVFSFSQAALDKLAEARENAPPAKQSGLDKILRLSDLESQIEQIDRHEERRPMNEAQLERLKRDYERLRDTPPKAPVQLTEQQIEDVLEKVKDRGIDPAKIGGADNYSFSHEGMIYTFRKDGTAWVHDGGIATSEEHKRMALQGTRDSISRFEATFLDDRSTQRADLVAERDALLAEQADTA